MLHARRDYDPIQDPRHAIPDDEPVLLIRGQDCLAADVARFWADRAAEIGVDHEVIDGVLRHADAIDAWQREHGSKVPDAPPGALR